MDNIIRAVGLSKQFQDIVAVKNANIEIKRGLFYAIMGRSGSGKTTLLSLLGMLDNATSGDMYVNNINISTMKEKDKALTRMKELGFIFQDYHLNPILKAYENVMVPMYINPEYKNKNMKKSAIELLNDFGLGDRVNHYPSQLSGGEKQRVAIARALTNDPECIFADEPTGNLDVESEKIVFDYLKKLVKRGKSVVVVSHNEIVLNYADQIYKMHEGILGRDTLNED